MAGLIRVNHELRNTSGTGYKGSVYGGSYGNSNGRDIAFAEQNIKKMAARQYCHIVLMIDRSRSADNTRDAMMGLLPGNGSNNTTISGYGYRYPFMTQEYVQKKLTERYTPNNNLSEGEVMPYHSAGYQRYRQIMDVLEESGAAFKRKDWAQINALDSAIKDYEATAEACKNLDREEYITAAKKLRKEYLSMVKKYKAY